MIEKVNTIIRDKSIVNQWRDTDTVINWFKNIDNKSNCIFMQFYPSISQSILMKAINHTKSFLTFSKKEVNTIMHSCKSLLFNKSVSIKKESDSDFNISTDSFDCAEIFDKIGVYILNILDEEYGKERVGLYKNTG